MTGFQAPVPIGFAPNPFDPAVMQTAIYKTMADAQAAIPDGHTHAFLFDASYNQANGPTGYASFVQKAPDGWNVVLSGEYDKPHGVTAGFMVAKSW